MIIFILLIDFSKLDESDVEQLKINAPEVYKKYETWLNTTQNPDNKIKSSLSDISAFFRKYNESVSYIHQLNLKEYFSDSENAYKLNIVSFKKNIRCFIVFYKIVF